MLDQRLKPLGSLRMAGTGVVLQKVGMVNESEGTHKVTTKER